MNRAFLLLMVLGLWAGTPSHARAEVPQKKTVLLNIREIPGDLQSAVVFQVEVNLQREMLSGNQIGWSIYEVLFTQYVDGTQRSWALFNAVFNTSDGLWWTTHADVENPALTEFSAMPYVGGVATSNDPAAADLDFSLAGATPGSQSPSQPTTLLTHRMQLAGASVPEEEGEEEPVDIGGTGGGPA